MAEQSPAPVAQAPEWLAAEMPPGYETRRWEIQRMTAELDAMDRVARVLWSTGEPLKDAVAALLAEVRCSVDSAPGAAGPIVARLGDARRLLVVVAGTAGPLAKSDEALARAFAAVQAAGDEDRVVFVATSDPASPPADRPDPLLPDALAMLQRMGVAVVSATTLFKLWRLAGEDPQKGRKALERLHAQDGGPFALPAR